MILVTGGTGFVGRVVALDLAAHGLHVAILSRKADQSTVGERVEFRQADLLDSRSIMAALADVTAVVHLAASLPASGLGADAITAMNVEGTRNLAQAALRAGVRQLVHASSAGVYGDGTALEPHLESGPVNPATPYERSKLAGELALRDVVEGSGIAWTILRPTGVFGPGGRASAALLREVAGRRLWLHGPTQVIVHPTYVQDVASAVRATLGHPDLSGETINIGGERIFQYPDYIALLAARLDVRVWQLQVPATGVRQAARVCGALMRSVTGQAPPAIARIGRAIVNRSVNIEKARRLLGFQPCSFDEALDETIRWSRREPPAGYARA